MSRLILIAQELDLSDQFVLHLCLRFDITNATNRAKIVTMAVETGNSGSTIS